MNFIGAVTIFVIFFEDTCVVSILCCFSSEYFQRKNEGKGCMYLLKSSFLEGV